MGIGTLKPKHLHEWEPRRTLPTRGKPSLIYLVCVVCGKKRPASRGKGRRKR